MHSDVKTLLQSGAQLTDAALERLLPSPDTLPHSIHRAMRHSVFAGGKRLQTGTVANVHQSSVANRARRAPVAIRRAARFGGFLYGGFVERARDHVDRRLDHGRAGRLHENARPRLSVNAKCRKALSGAF